MSIKKTSILALSVLLSYESFAAPTVLATTPRLGASSSVASTGRGKATTSVSIGGGLNKLTSNRGQSSFTPNSAPTDKQNELIENFQKEIQNVRDAVAEELQAQNDKIRELESVIEEKDEKIAELEESIDEKIESKGFVTAESVTSEISTAKQEAVRQATNAAVKEVNSMGFAKTATVQSDILTAKNAAIAQAKTEAVAEVNGMGFAKTTTIESDILTAKNAAIEQAKNEAVAAVNSMGFATNASVQNLKSEITTERNAALKSYATSEQVSSAVTAAKDAAIAAANTAIAAEAATRSAIVETLATKKELETLEVGVDKTAVEGIVDEVLGAKKFISEDTPAFKEVQQQVAEMPTTYAKSSALTEYAKSSALTEYAKTSALTDLDTRVTQNTQNITATQAEVDNISDTIAGDLLADTTFKEGVLAGLSTDLKELPSRVDNLEKPTTLEGLLSGKFVKPDTLTGYATKGELGDYAKLVNVEALNTELTNLKNPKTLADYLGDTYVTPGKFDTVLSANGKFKELNNTVSGLGTTYATKASLEELQNAKTLANLLGDTYVTPDKFDNVLSANGKFKELNNTVSSLGDTYATKVSLENLQNAKTLANLLGDTYVTPDKFDNVLSANGTFSALNTRVNGLGNTVSTLESSVTSLSNSIDELEQRVPVDDGDPDHEMVTPGN